MYGCVMQISVNVYIEDMDIEILKTTQCNF